MTWAWWPHTTDARVASYRLRCLQIVDALRVQGHAAGLYTPGNAPPGVLVLSKRYDEESMSHAAVLSRQHGTRLVLDLCDNHFHYPATANGSLQRRAEALRSAVSRVDLVTTASQALKEVVSAECPSAPAIVVVDDAAEDPFDPGWSTRWSHWRDELALRGLRSWLTPFPRERRLVWFGNHGSPGMQAGLSELEKLQSPLEAAAISHGPLCLTLISNHAGHAAQLTRDWKIPTRYLPWQASTFSRALRDHSATLIPITPNPFTRCKTANRVLTAYAHRLNVIADSIPSYLPFADCAVLDDWGHGLHGYLSDAARRQADVAQGQARLQERYSLAHITAQWVSALATVSPAAA